MDRKEFMTRSGAALRALDDALGDLDDALDVELGGDVLTLTFEDGARFIINAHSAAGQIWMAAGTTAWHFDWVPARECWIASRSGDELGAAVTRVVGDKLGRSLDPIAPPDLR